MARNATHPNGFSLAELLLVVAVTSVLLLAGAPVYGSYQVTNEVDVATNVIVQDLYQAQSYSRDSARDAQWGMAINGNTVTLFAGSSFANRTVAFDQNYVVPSSVSIGGTTAEVYTKLTGLPTGSGTITLSGGGKSRTVTWNSKGMVDY